MIISPRKMPELDKRLSMTAGLVTPGFPLADIGTDHAYLPCRLVSEGITPRAVAADVAEGPLQNARKTVEKYGLADRIKCVKSDGLHSLDPSDCRELVIAGMGGNLITDILAAAKWIKSPEVHLILQPMTHSEDVRRFLLTEGFSIEKETAVRDGKKLYIAISASYSGNRVVPDGTMIYFGLHTESNTADSEEFIRRQKSRLTKKLRGLELTGNLNTPEAEEIAAALCDSRIQKIKL